MSVSFHSNPWRNVAVGLASHSNRRDTHIIMSHHVSSCSDLRACSPISCANMWPVLLRWWSGGGVYECILSFKVKLSMSAEYFARFNCDEGLGSTASLARI